VSNSFVFEIITKIGFVFEIINKIGLTAVLPPCLPPQWEMLYPTNYSNSRIDNWFFCSKIVGPEPWHLSCLVIQAKDKMAKNGRSWV